MTERSIADQISFCERQEKRMLSNRDAFDPADEDYEAWTAKAELFRSIAETLRQSQGCPGCGVPARNADDWPCGVCGYGHSAIIDSHTPKQHPADIVEDLLRQLREAEVGPRPDPIEQESIHDSRLESHQSGSDPSPSDRVALEEESEAAVRAIWAYESDVLRLTGGGRDPEGDPLVALLLKCQTAISNLSRAYRLAGPRPDPAPWQDIRRHGRDCPKVAHVGGGYLHGADDDRPYDVDGKSYCGRCHGWLESALPTKSHSPLCQPFDAADCELLERAAETLDRPRSVPSLRRETTAFEIRELWTRLRAALPVPPERPA